MAVYPISSYQFYLGFLDGKVEKRNCRDPNQSVVFKTGTSKVRQFNMDQRGNLWVLTDVALKVYNRSNQLIIEQNTLESHQDINTFTLLMVSNKLKTQILWWDSSKSF